MTATNMANKLYKITSGAKSALLELPEAYDGIATEVGLVEATEADISAHPTITASEAAKSGLVAQVSIGLTPKGRKHIKVSVEKLGGISKLIGSTFGTKTIKSASLRTYRKLR
ncbi:hypothetical protein [Pseudanabaena sp. 'Roaring Creek']|uniref:hypothetical protein n=1 Tax=Pseudanabaena sp. 'Roaring Creek' TaxID=1681830 RepID=UPI0006D77A1E|nr:hypothetical protein [Pseudanabaena sp. 'Roaring Creek']